MHLLAAEILAAIETLAAPLVGVQREACPVGQLVSEVGAEEGGDERRGEGCPLAGGCECGRSASSCRAGGRAANRRQPSMYVNRNGGLD